MLDSLLWYLKVPGLNIVEHVATLHVLEHYIVEITILKEIYQVHNIWMLAHFKHLNFSPLLEYLDWLHIFFMDCLDCHLPSVPLVSAQFYKAELTLT